MADHAPVNVEMFLQDRSSDLKRIASRTNGELSFEDLGHEAWFIAAEIGARRGSPVDFADAINQDQVLSWLYTRFVKHADKSIRHAARIDQESRDDEGKKVENVLMRLLAAPETSDPLVLLQTTEEQKDYLALVRSSYSQATAYVLLLLRFGRDDLATYLRIAAATLVARIHRAADRFRVQPSMFDGIEAIDEDFMPAPGRSRPAKKPRQYERREWGLWPSNAWTTASGPASG